MHTELWWGKLKDRAYLEDLGLKERIILNLISKKYGGRHGLDKFG